jgi:hypothetical protein
MVIFKKGHGINTIRPLKKGIMVASHRKSPVTAGACPYKLKFFIFQAPPYFNRIIFLVSEYFSVSNL